MITLVANLKGGAGKSTVSFNLGIWLQNAGCSVLAYDLDPQCTLTDVVEVRNEQNIQPELKVYTRYQKPKKAVDEVIIDVGTANMPALKKAVSIADRIVMPVGPSQADVWSTQRFLYLISSIKPNKKRGHDAPADVFAFLNRADTHAAVPESDDTLEALKSLPGIQVMDARLCLRTVYRRSFSEGLAVFELKPSSKGAQEFNTFAQTLYPEHV